MTETKWTPGPWTTDESEHDAPHENIKIRGSKYHTICTVWIDDACHDRNGEQTANARLMVAAPDLYAALEETLEIAARNESGDYIERANAAMRKARGE